MRLIYIRTAKGLPRQAEQMAAIAAASGATAEEQADAWVDSASRGKAVRQDERERMLGAVREGDEVWVARPAVVGSSEPDILDFLARMTAMGGVLCVASTGGRHRYSPELAEALRLVADIRADERAVVMARARANITRRAGPTYTEDQWRFAEGLWRDMTVTAEDAGKRTGISVRHLYRRFGPKGTAPFVGGPKKRGRK